MHRHFFAIVALLSCLSYAPIVAQGVASYPYITISFDSTDSAGESKSGVTTFQGSAPIETTFHFETHDDEGWQLTYEWRFCHEGGSLDEPYMVRYEESPTVTFTQAGCDSVALYAVFTQSGMPSVEYRSNYWRDGVSALPLTIKACESVLTFPNAFSPNGDGINDFFKPKTCESIVEFKATIYNRWGQKIYEWNDVRAEGWDGTYHGKDVAPGVYYVLVKAKGSDGREFNIKKDVNILRGYIDEQ